jgi:hypothetical protein
MHRKSSSLLFQPTPLYLLEEDVMSDSTPIANTTSADKERVVDTVQDLLDAISDPSIKTVIIETNLSDVPSIRLSPGTALRGSIGARTEVRFAKDVDGVCLSSNNAIANLDLRASDERCAIWNDESVSGLGVLELRNLKTTGRVRILARGNIRDGHIIVEDLDVVSADTRAEKERPHEYGVDVLQGAFTLWNMQSDNDVVITADLLGLSVGRLGAPVLGSGIFVSGASDVGGRLEVQHLWTGSVYSDGRIEPGTAALISGGVFVLYGARVDWVETSGPVTTYGPNDMALDNWGVVERWIIKDKITTLGPSGVGFVNFGYIGKLHSDAPIETFGQGARGFNVYTGTVRLADFDRIVTHADGAVGVQISQPVGTMIVRRGIETHGSIGDSLVKGVVMKLPATALSIKPGGSAESIRIQGGLRTHGQGVLPLEQRGMIASLHIEGGCTSDPIT